jgi:hypothetical protein
MGAIGFGAVFGPGCSCKDEVDQRLAASSDSYLACTKFTPLEPETPQILAYVARVGTPSGWPTCLAISILRLHRFVYTRSKFGPTLTGDCDKSTASIGGGPALGFAIKTFGSIAAPFTFGLSGLLGFIGGIFTAHARAVAKEQGTLCAFAGAYNQFADVIEPKIQSGEITVGQAIQALEKAQKVLFDALGPINDGSNAGWGYSFALDALVLYNKEVIYPKLAGGMLGGNIGKAIAIGGGYLVARAVL